MNSPGKGRANSKHVERSKPVEKWTVVFAAFSAVWLVAEFVFVKWPTFALDRRQKEVEVTLVESEIVTIEGQWLAPEVRTEVDGAMVAVSPVYIDILNNGKTQVKIRKVEFRILEAQLESVVALNGYSLERMKADLQRNDAGLAPLNETESKIFGFIDSDSVNWQERASIEIKDSTGIVPPGQRRTERRHVIAEPENDQRLIKVEVSVVTDKSTYRWYGFSPTASALCRPVPFSGDVYSSPIPAPADPQ